MSVILKTTKIINEWTDYNNHMNLSYYILVFDKAAEKMLSNFKMGEEAAINTKRSTMVVETHTTYNNEVKENEEVNINLIFFDHDKKRLHYKLEMIEKNSKKLSSTIEMISLYVDLKERRVAEFEENKLKLMDNFINVNKSQFTSDLKFSSKLKK